VVTEAAAAIRDAVAALKPAGSEIRHGRMQPRALPTIHYAPQLYDPRVNVMQAVGADGAVIATLVNYAVHPEVLGADAGICSPDLIGPLYDRLAELGAGTGIFMNSAQGGMVTAGQSPARTAARRATWEECRRIRSAAGRGIAARGEGCARRRPNPKLARRLAAGEVPRGVRAAARR
jgi:hypothetical protein